ncbi:hypothetical protein M9H77_07495 [Catharanthus roseus]|uniref:Uncharacterized protein n=1 Tax=Catharanthus roseus TaxID=4058 RepID=A0ACC0BVA4_CATRO|nr:hypothetical protein M9H77_07495 [Catharanthus roseus]
MDEALKNKFEEFKGQGKVSKLFSICSISKNQSREEIGGELTNSPALTVSGRLPPMKPFEDGTLPRLGLKHMFQHGRRVSSCAMNASSLEMIGTTIIMPDKGCEGLKKRRKPIMSKVVKEALVDTQCMIINGDMITFLLILDPLSIIFMIAMRAIDLQIEITIMIHLVKDFQQMMLERDEIM